MKQNGNSRQFVMICVISFAFFLSNQMVVNTVTKFAGAMDATAQMIGFIGGAYGIFALLMRPVSGQMVDKYAHKPLMFVGIGLLLVSNLLLLVAKQPSVLLLSRILNGIAFGVVSTLCMTTACDALPPEKMTSGIGIYTMMQTLAQVIGPSIAISIIDVKPFHSLYMLTTAIMGVALLLCLGFRSSHTLQKNVRISFKPSSMFTFKAFKPGSVLMCNVMQISAVSSFLLLYADSIGVTGLSGFFTVQALMIIVTRPFVSKFANERNAYPVVFISEMLIILGLVNLFFADSTMDFMLSAALFGLGKSGYQPSLMSMCISAAPAQERGRASGTAYACNDIGQFLGSYIAGYVVGILGYRFAFLTIALIIAVGTTIFALTCAVPDRRRMKEKRIVEGK